METRTKTYLKNSLSILALLLTFASLQSPLWQPAATPRPVTAMVGGSVSVPYKGVIEKATIFQNKTATLSAGTPGEILIHGKSPGKTNLLIRFKGGETELYEITIITG